MSRTHALSSVDAGPRVVFAAGLSIAAGVLVAYASTDGGGHLAGLSGRLWRDAIRIALALAGLGFAIGCAHRAVRSRAGAMVTAITIAAIALWVIEGGAARAARQWSEAIDGWRASTLVAWSAIFGAMLTIGAGNTAVTRLHRAWLVARALPFVFITTAAGAWLTAVGLVWMIALAYSVGASSVRRFQGVRDDPPPELAIALGLTILMLLTLALGLAGTTSRAALLTVAIVASLIARRDLSHFAQRLTRCVIASPPATPSVAAAHGALIALGSMYWIAALAPEVGSDAIGFRIAAPVHWLRAHAITPIPEMLGSYGVCGGEALWLFTLPVLGTCAAKLMQAAIAALLLHGMLREGGGAGSASACWTGVLFFGSTLPWVQVVWGFVDLLQLFFSFAAIVGVLRWRARRERGGARTWLVVSGASAGAAAAVKLNGCFALLIAGCIAALAVRPQRSLRAWLMMCAAVGLPFIGVLAPWLLRSYWLTGNPVFPFANRLFESPLAPLDIPAIAFGTGHALLDIIRLPLAVFWTPNVLSEIGTYHPGLLALLPLGLACLCTCGETRGLSGLWLGVAISAGALWAVTDQNARYGMLGFFCLAIAMARGFSVWERRSPRSVARALGAALPLVAILGLPFELLRSTTWLWRGHNGSALPTSVVVGDLSSCDYLEGLLPGYTCAEWLNRQRGANARVWQVFTRDHLHFDAETAALPHAIRSIAAPLEELLWSPELQADPEAIHRRLRSEGYTHVLVWTGAPLLANRPDDRRTGVLGREFMRRCLIPCAGSLDTELYEIRRAPLTADEAAGEEEAESDVLADTPFERGPDGRAVARVPVDGGELYAVDMALGPDPKPATLTVQVEWRGNGDRLASFWRRELPPVAAGGSFRSLQTAPRTATSVVISLFGGNGAPPDVRLLHVRREP